MTVFYLREEKRLFSHYKYYILKCLTLLYLPSWYWTKEYLSGTDRNIYTKSKICIKTPLKISQKSTKGSICISIKCQKICHICGQIFSRFVCMYVVIFKSTHDPSIVCHTLDIKLCIHYTHMISVSMYTSVGYFGFISAPIPSSVKEHSNVLSLLVEFVFGCWVAFWHYKFIRNTLFCEFPSGAEEKPV